MVRAFRLSVPIPREVYTIRSFAQRVEGPGYLLNEIHNEEFNCPLNGTIEIAIDAMWLRPLVERKTDISFAHEILRKVSRKHGADA